MENGGFLTVCFVGGFFEIYMYREVLWANFTHMYVNQELCAIRTFSNTCLLHNIIVLNRASLNGHNFSSVGSKTLFFVKV